MRRRKIAGRVAQGCAAVLLVVEKSDRCWQVPVNKVDRPERDSLCGMTCQSSLSSISEVRFIGFPTPQHVYRFLQLDHLSYFA